MSSFQKRIASLHGTSPTPTPTQSIEPASQPPSQDTEQFPLVDWFVCGRNVGKAREWWQDDMRMGLEHYVPHAKLVSELKVTATCNDVRFDFDTGEVSFYVGEAFVLRLDLEEILRECPVGNW